MGAEPLQTALEEPGFQSRVASLRDEHAALWIATPAELPVLGPPTGLRAHFANARAAARLIDELAGEAVCVPDGEPESRAWRETVRERLQAFGDARLGWPAGYRRLVFADAFFAASVAFAREARAFDPNLPLGDLWQALRNVWIGNSLQMLLDLPVRLGPGLFAYSMLYPLTDNLLDDPQVAAADKRSFNEHFGRRLAGLPERAANAGEAAVFRLVAKIEEEFPRRRCADVYESLLAIHGGQVRSLTQQDDPSLTDAEILAISCEKGGASVLADLYLVAGSAGREDFRAGLQSTAAEERFAFGYGVALQLLDDLQDVERDLAARHQTLFTRAARRGPLDAPAAALARFIDRVLDEAEIVSGPEYADRTDLIRRNCRALLVSAVAEQPRRFSRRFRRTLARRWPLSFRAMRRLRRRAERRCRDAARALERRTGATSVLDWLLAETGEPSERSPGVLPVVNN
jgi:hypothetical protein